MFPLAQTRPDFITIYLVYSIAGKTRDLSEDTMINLAPNSVYNKKIFKGVLY